MKTKLTLLIAALAFSVIGSTAQADQRMIYNNRGQLIAVVQNASQENSGQGGQNKYVPVTNFKGGTVLAQTRDSGAATNIALFKSSKTSSCEGGSCCTNAKH